MKHFFGGVDLGHAGREKSMHINDKFIHRLQVQLDKADKCFFNSGVLPTDITSIGAMNDESLNCPSVPPR